MLSSICTNQLKLDIKSQDLCTKKKIRSKALGECFVVSNGQKSIFRRRLSLKKLFHCKRLYIYFQLWFRKRFGLLLFWATYDLVLCCVGPKVWKEYRPPAHTVTQQIILGPLSYKITGKFDTPQPPFQKQWSKSL